MRDKDEKHTSVTEAEKNVERWKVKKLITRLEHARGDGPSMVSLIIPPTDQISRVSKMLAEEFGIASNIGLRAHRLSALSAIMSAQRLTRLHKKIPANGLVIYCGETLTAEGRTRYIRLDFEPYKRITTFLYFCDNRFHTEALSELLESDQTFGFIVMDGNGALFGTLSGNNRDIVHKFLGDLPTKHGSGGQSALHYARSREERYNYARKVTELAIQNFITSDNVNVAGVILAASTNFNSDLNQSDLIDNRLQLKVLKVVNVSDGGENGFNQAIELSSETLRNIKFIQEKTIINKYFDEISKDSGRVCCGVDDTLIALKLGTAETVIVYENLDVVRWCLTPSDGGTEIIRHRFNSQEEDRSLFIDKETGQEMEVASQMPLLEWMAERYRDFGATLEFVSNHSSEGNRFVEDFGGIGAILKRQGHL